MRDRGKLRSASNCSIVQTASASNASMAAFIAVGVSDIRVIR